MSRFKQIVQPLLRSVLFLSAITISSVQAADTIDLIIDTDPGADDVVALLLALASPEQLNVRAITTVAGNVRLDKTSRNARLPGSGPGGVTTSVTTFIFPTSTTGTRALPARVSRTC